MKINQLGRIWAGLVAAGCLLSTGALADSSPIAQTYADIALAMYEDALTRAKELDAATKAFLQNPTAETLEAARAAWKEARIPYQQTEGYRFGNAVVDDWEGRVNAWPLDEGLIDYVDASYGSSSDENPLYVLNVVASTSLQLGPDKIDATVIDKTLLAEKLHGGAGVESNVATGYHAIEFLLWGQDLNGTGPGAGNRPATDFDPANCTNGNCDRRAAYLSAATELLVDDLQEMVTAWGEGGAARAAVTDVEESQVISTILTGIGSLSYGELGGERMKLGLMLHDTEEEHDCFSDNTHNSHYYDQVGMIAIYQGKYQRIDGSVVEGPSVAALAAERAKDANDQVMAAMQMTEAKLKAIKDTADSGQMAYDQMIGPDNAAGNALVSDAILSLVDQTRAIEALVQALGVEIKVEGSDSLDNPSAVVTQ